MTDRKDDYRRYSFYDDTNLIPRELQWKYYFDSKFADIDIDTEEIKETVEVTINEGLDNKFPEIHEHIDSAKEEIAEDISTSETNIISKIDEIKIDVPEIIENITEVINEAKTNINENIEDAEHTISCQICCAKNEIIEHIDNKFEEANFEENFSNLNEQVTEILNKLDNQ
jgi:outer membrane protein assembly factor BamA